MRLPKDYAAPRQEETAVEYIWEQKGCVQQRREPIVRCRDCKHYGGEWASKEITPYLKVCYRLHAIEFVVEPDGFCAWGERKADA